MIGGGRIPDAVLAEMLGRLAVALGAGIDLRRAWSLEEARVPRRWRSAVSAVGRDLAAGDDLPEALRRCGAEFPAEIVALVEVGTRTGRETEIFRDIAESLRGAVQGRRDLKAALVKPALQLALAAAVVGLLIVVGGAAGGPGGGPLDFLGLGLVGRRGLTVYLGILAASAVTAAALAPLVRRSWRARGLVHVVGARLPVLGPAVAAAEEAAWCRAASLATGVGLDAGAVVGLASAAAPALALPPREIEERVRAGASLEEALRDTGHLSPRVLEAVAVGEMTGTVSEALDRQADRLAAESRAGFKATVEWTGWLAWAAVALVIALVVWRFFAFYTGMIHDALGAQLTAP